MSRLRRHARAFAIYIIVGAGCHHSQPAIGAPAPARSPEGYCWWTAWHTPLAPDTVAARYTSAFAATGLTGAAWTRIADTAWAYGGPTLLHRGDAEFMYESRIVAYRRSDTTVYRPFVGLTRAGIMMTATR
jgi:hypothetical protein